MKNVFVKKKIFRFVFISIFLLVISFFGRGKAYASWITANQASPYSSFLTISYSMEGNDIICRIPIASKMKIYKSTNGSNWTLWASKDINAPTSYSFTDQNTQFGNSYRYMLIWNNGLIPFCSSGSGAPEYVYLYTGTITPKITEGIQLSGSANCRTESSIISSPKSFPTNYLKWNQIPGAYSYTIMRKTSSFYSTIPPPIFLLPPKFPIATTLGTLFATQSQYLEYNDNLKGTYDYYGYGTTLYYRIFVTMSNPVGQTYSNEVEINTNTHAGVINNFTTEDGLTSKTINSGEKIKLKWDFSSLSNKSTNPALSIILNPGNINLKNQSIISNDNLSASGTVEVSPTENTTYTLSISNGSSCGPVNKNVSILVNANFGSLTIKGDIFAEKDISGITVDKNSVIATKTVSSATGSQWQINKYSPTELLQLAKFMEKMNITVNRLTNEYATKITNQESQFSTGALYLNTSQNNITTPSDNINIKPEGKVWLVDNGRDVVINNITTVYGVGTIIIKSGNLIINQNINYGTGNKNSIGFIVLNGNIEIGSDVSSLNGAFYAPGDASGTKGKIIFH